MDYHISNSAAAVLGVLVIWELFWKGLALWKAAKNDQTAWYLVILIVNSVGVIPIIYLLLNRDSSTTKPAN